MIIQCVINANSLQRKLIFQYKSIDCLKIFKQSENPVTNFLKTYNEDKEQTDTLKVLPGSWIIWQSIT